MLVAGHAMAGSEVPALKNVGVQDLAHQHLVAGVLMLVAGHAFRGSGSRCQDLVTNTWQHELLLLVRVAYAALSQARALLPKWHFFQVAPSTHRSPGVSSLHPT